MWPEGVQFTVDRQCDEYENDSGIRVSRQTRILIADMAISITEDPHRSWKATPKDLRETTGKYLESIPERLREVQEKSEVTDVITAFDFLHWFSKVLDGTFCIIQK